MTVYIEYAILENLLYDGVFLSLALYAAKEKLRVKRILFSAFMGAAFALVYPFLSLPSLLLSLLKLVVGFLLCMLAFGRIKRREEWARYGLTCLFFFLFSFGFGGALTALTRGFPKRKIPSWIVFLGTAALSLLSIYSVKKLYARRRIYQYIYTCEIHASGEVERAQGFFDSGNIASKNGVPVCFLSPELFYDLFLSKNAEGWEQVRDEMKIKTLSGTKKVPLYQGEISILDGEKRGRMTAYFAPSANMIGRAYKRLLNARTFEG